MPKAVVLATGVSDIVESNKKSLGTVMSAIRQSLQKGFNHQMEVGIQLGLVRGGKLYEQEQCTSFKEFVEIHFAEFFNFKHACHLIHLGEAYNAIRQRLEGRKDIPLPTTENQLRPLLTFDDYKAAELYEVAFQQAQRTGEKFTGEFLHAFINSGIPEVESSPVTQSAHVPGDWSNGDAETGDVVDFSDVIDVIPAKRWSSEAVATLDKLHALCAEGLLPDNLRKEIDTERRLVPDDDLSRLGRYPEPKFTQMARLMFNAGLPLLRASRLIEQPLDADTTFKEAGYKYHADQSLKTQVIEFMGLTITIAPSVPVNA